MLRDGEAVGTARLASVPVEMELRFTTPFKSLLYRGMNDKHGVCGTADFLPQ